MHPTYLWVWKELINPSCFWLNLSITVHQIHQACLWVLKELAASKHRLRSASCDSQQSYKDLALLMLTVLDKVSVFKKKRNSTVYVRPKSLLRSLLPVRQNMICEVCFPLFSTDWLHPHQLPCSLTVVSSHSVAKFKSNIGQLCILETAPRDCVHYKSFARHKSMLLRMKQQNVQMRLTNTIAASSVTQAKGALATHGLPKRSADGICFHSSNNLSSWERAGRHSANHLLVSVIIYMFMYSAPPPPPPRFPQKTPTHTHPRTTKPLKQPRPQPGEVKQVRT